MAVDLTSIFNEKYMYAAVIINLVLTIKVCDDIRPGIHRIKMISGDIGDIVRL